MSQTAYNKIRFIGYAVPTTPADVVDIGNPNGPGAVAGYYLANTNIHADIDARIAIMKNAIELAASKLPASDGTTLNLFVAPEFYFHGVHGPYIYTDKSNDPVTYLKQQLESSFNNETYKDWTFVFGSCITTLVKDIDSVLASESALTKNSIVENLSKNWLDSYGPLKGVILDMLINFIKNSHGYPNCEVRNRSVIISHAQVTTPDKTVSANAMITEKYYCSNEDYLLYSTNGSKVVTEQMVAYPIIDLSTGDAKHAVDDMYAIFNQNGTAGTTQMAVEICLDHADVRLRKNTDNLSDSVTSINVQIMPSCGMQIIGESIAAGANGFVFNCDGQYFLNGNATGAEAIKMVNSVYANYSNHETYNGRAISYGAHTQFAQVLAGPIKGNPISSGASNAVTKKQTSTDCLKVYPVTVPEHLNFSDYFAGGPGEIHIYGSEIPFDLNS
ncbi:hypothetical protein [Formosa sp. PL04]|uniref:hypothetical protein n=1 Tax=Formosa sp. PL04 TaxID=3081755 RepID=UPI002982886B|nr:hypothetical protein [Formosa sp. PL04]MDW5290097.1 hypothetical protein [Formosa sp. PL04]